MLGILAYKAFQLGACRNPILIQGGACPPPPRLIFGSYRLPIGMPDTKGLGRGQTSKVITVLGFRKSTGSKL